MNTLISDNGCNRRDVTYGVHAVVGDKCQFPLIGVSQLLRSLRLVFKMHYIQSYMHYIRRYVFCALVLLLNQKKKSTPRTACPLTKVCLTYCLT